MTQSNIIVSVIIPHWNGIDVLSECLDSLKKTNFDFFEIIVSDNASSDGSQAWVKENHPDIILVENDKNYGYAGGCNRGVNLAKGKYLLFLNNDTIQDPNWLQPLVDRLESDSSIAAVQPKILNYYKRDVFDYAGGSGGFMDIFCFPFARGRLFLNQEKDTGQYDEAQSCFWASGTAMMVRKDIFESAGKFDETFFAHMEEIDLCWRAFNLGFDCYSVTSSKVFHVGAATIKKNSKKIYLNYRNSLLMMTKNLPLKDLLSTLFVRLNLDIISSFKLLIQGDISFFIAVYKAHIDYFFMLRSI